MRRSALVAALVLAFGTGTMAIAQTVGGDGPPEDPGAIAEQASSFGACVSEAGEAGGENPTELCADLKPGGEGEESSDRGPAAGTHAAACEGESKKGGDFGRCVSERAGAFGRCVNEQAQDGVRNPAAACDDAKPGQGGSTGKPEAVPTGKPEGTPGGGKPEGTPSGKPEGVPTGKPEGTPGGKPEGTPDGGKPEGTPTGKPEGTSTGKPEGTPTGKPEGTPGGKPQETPGGPGG